MTPAFTVTLCPPASPSKSVDQPPREAPSAPRGDPSIPSKESCRNRQKGVGKSSFDKLASHTLRSWCRVSGVPAGHRPLPSESPARSSSDAVASRRHHVALATQARSVATGFTLRRKAALVAAVGVVDPIVSPWCRACRTRSQLAFEFAHFRASQNRPQRDGPDLMHWPSGRSQRRFWVATNGIAGADVIA